MHVPAARIIFSPEDRAEIVSATTEILSTGAMTLGAHTDEFEAAFAAAHRAPFAVAVSSGTAALEIILRSLGVQGADVVVPTNTFAATAFAVLRAGANPVFADVSPDTLTLTARDVEAVLTHSTRAVILVHVGGLIPPDIAELVAFCAGRGLLLVEDAAHAHGCRHGETYAGSFGVAGAFSFYPTKLITSGEGGMIVTADPTIHEAALVYRDQGKAGFLGNTHIKQGYAWRLSEMHAVTGKVHLRHLDEFLAVRAAVAARYDAALDALDGVVRLRVPADDVCNYYKYIVLPRPGVDRARLKKELKERHGVSLSGEVYEAPLHQQPVFSDYVGRSLPVAEDLCARHVCLPIHSDMTDAEADHVVTSFAAALASLDLDGCA